MKKIIEIKSGNLLTTESAAPLVQQPGETLEQAVKRMRKWRERWVKGERDVPPSAKIGGTVYWLKDEILSFINAQFNKAS